MNISTGDIRQPIGDYWSISYCIDYYWIFQQEISDSLGRFRSRFECDDYCSAVVVLMSHGNTGVIKGIDETSVQLRNIYSMFEGHRCPALLGKPKLFFIQACRGGILVWYLCMIILELACHGSVLAERLRAPNSNSGVSDQQCVGLNPQPGHLCP